MTALDSGFLDVTHTQRRRSCQVCDCSEVRHLFNNEMAALAQVDLSYQVGDCPQCGFSFAYQLPEDSTYQSYYRTLSKYDVSATLSQSDHLRFDSLVRLFSAYLEPEALIVDIGCGEGALLSQLSAAGFSRLYGVDPAPNAPTVAQIKYGLQNVRSGFFYNAAEVVPLSQADGICIAAVLEHLPNLRADLQQLLGQLKPGCNLVIEVPALELFGTGEGEPFGEFSLEHVNYFSRDSLSQLMASLGWQCKHSEYLVFPQWQTGSVLSVFAKTIAADNPTTFSVPRLDGYLQSCSEQVLAMLQQVPGNDLIVWGAGSHSARILPLLKSIPGLRVRALVDTNSNLTGKTLGEWTIQLPSAIAKLPEMLVLVSSFRTQKEIAQSLRQNYPNPLLLLYR